MRLILCKHLKTCLKDKFSKEIFQAELADYVIELFKDSDILVSLEIFHGVIEIMLKKFT